MQTDLFSYAMFVVVNHFTSLSWLLNDPIKTVSDNNIAGKKVKLLVSRRILLFPYYFNPIEDINLPSSFIRSDLGQDTKEPQLRMVKIQKPGKTWIM